MVQLESDLRIAAELGQHLLKRHDDYVLEVQKEKHGFLMEIERQSNFAKLVDELETNNRLLELQNEQAMRENLALLKRLEDLNSSLNVADTRNHELRTNLLEAETTVGRLSHRATKARGLEAQITTAELEREVLEQDLAALSLTSHQSDARYRKAERHIEELQRQLETIERESLGFEHHSVTTHAKNRGPVYKVSVNDVLENESVPEMMDTLVQNNTNLEKNNAELQRVLTSTQDEVVMLRERLASQDKSRTTGLILDEDRVPRKSVSQELHQHNHYHYHIQKPANKRASLSKEMPNPRGRSSADSKLVRNVMSGNGQGQLKDRSRDSVSTQTPVKSNIHLGMASPPSTQKRNRDSGYFSFASESGRERSTSLTNPASPNSLLFTDTMQTSTPRLRKHLRSSSHESVFMLQTNILHSPKHETANNSTALLPSTPHHLSKQDLISPVPGLQTSGYAVLRHSTSHESVLDTCEHVPITQMYPSKANASRRPYPSPLQNTASSATVSVTSATAYNSHSSSITMASPRGKSYTALRSAAAAQRLSPSTLNPPPVATSQFWKRNSDKTVPSLTKSLRSSSSRWTSLVPKWASSGDQGSPASSSQEALAKATAPATICHEATTQKSTAERGTAVSLTGAEEALLREALDF